MLAKLLQLCLTLCNPMDCSPPGSSVHGIDSPGKNIGVGCHTLLQGIFSTQGWNWCLFCLLHWQVGVFVFLFFFLTTSAPWEAHTCAYLYVNDITWHKIAHTHTTLSYLYIYIYIYISTCITTYTWFLYITISPSINYTPTFFFLLSSSMIKL